MTFSCSGIDLDGRPIRVDFAGEGGASGGGRTGGGGGRRKNDSEDLSGYTAHSLCIIVVSRST